MGFTNNDILTLARAGFTASQISALNSVGANPPAPTPKLVNPAPAGAMTVPAQTITPTYNANDTLDKILSAIQTSAINSTQQPQPQTTDDILAEIINPPTND